MEMSTIPKAILSKLADVIDNLTNISVTIEEPKYALGVVSAKAVKFDLGGIKNKEAK